MAPEFRQEGEKFSIFNYNFFFFDFFLFLFVSSPEPRAADVFLLIMRSVRGRSALQTARVLFTFQCKQTSRCGAFQVGGGEMK